MEMLSYVVETLVSLPMSCTFGLEKQKNKTQMWWMAAGYILLGSTEFDFFHPLQHTDKLILAFKMLSCSFSASVPA